MSREHLNARPLLPGDRERIELIAGGLADAVDAKGRYHPSHCHSVARLAHTIGARMGIGGHALFRLRIAGMLHDVGKLFVDDSILLAPRRLAESEMEVVKRHPVAAHEILSGLGLYDEARWVLHHHEAGDGTGYPSGLPGAAIPLGSRILAVADAYDVMVTRRVYKDPLTREQALAELRRCSPVQFDPQVVVALEDVLSQGDKILGRTPPV